MVVFMSTDTESQDVLSQLSHRAKALAHPIRLQMVKLMQGREQLCICEVTDHFDVSQPTLSHHLKVLRQAGLIDSEPEGTRSLYHVVPEAFQGLAQLTGNCANA